MPRWPCGAWHGRAQPPAASRGPGRGRHRHPPRQPERQALRARGQGGEVSQAFGFDITPLVARAAEFAAEAEAVRAAALALRIARERLTLLRRDCMKLILAWRRRKAGRGARAPADPVPDHPRGPRPVGRARRSRHGGGGPVSLSVDVGNLLLAHADVPKTSGNAPQDERHKQNSNPTSLILNRPSNWWKKEPSAGLEPKAVEAGRSGGVRGGHVSPGHRPRCLPGHHRLCAGGHPHLARSRGDGRCRPLRPGDQPPCVARGAGRDGGGYRRRDGGGDPAALRTDQEPGGYLRSLVERKRAGEYSLAPSCRP